jgi:hypothetical protein
MEWLLWIFAGVIAVYLILTLWLNNPFKKPDSPPPADYEKGWRDFYK